MSPSRSTVNESVHLRPSFGRSRDEISFSRVRVGTRVYDLRVYRLLVSIRHFEEFADRIPEAKYNILLDDAILECGFADEVEALRAILNEFGDGLGLTD